jgi:hypothetical protein
VLEITLHSPIIVPSCISIAQEILCGKKCGQKRSVDYGIDAGFAAKAPPV